MSQKQLRLRLQTARPIPCSGSYMRSTLCRSASWPKKYFCIPATSPPAERVFSTCGNIVICHTAGQRRSQIRRTGLLFWHIILTLTYTLARATLPYSKSKLENATLSFWCMFIEPEYEKGSFGTQVFVSPPNATLKKMSADDACFASS